MAEPRPFSWAASAIGAGVVNFVINAPIGWLIVPASGSLGVWTIPGVALDLMFTAYGVAFGTGLVVTPQTRKQVERGQLIPPALPDRLRNHFAGWPRTTLIRANNLGMLSVALFLPLPLLALYALHVQPLDRLSVTLLKGTFAFIVGAVVTPFIAAAATVPVKNL
jgi:hypothetical protein